MAQPSADGPQAFASSERSLGAPSVAPGRRGLGLEAAVGYGYVDGSPSDHRFAFEARVDGRPLADLALRATFRTRIDRVEGDALRSTLTGAFGLTYGHLVRPELALGASLDASFGGADFFDLDLGATRIVGRVGMVYRWKSSGAALAFDIGYLHDRTANILPAGADPSPGDRVALGVDEYNALPMRLSASLGWAELRGWVMVEASPRLGADAPLDGSLRIVGGLLGGLRPTLGWSAFASVSLAATPDTASLSPLRSVPARVGVGFGLRFDPFAPESAPAEPEPDPEPEVEPEPAPEPTPIVVVPPPVRTLAGHVHDDMDYPLEAAIVHYQAGEMQGTTTTATDGSFRIDGLPVEIVMLEVNAEGFEPLVREVGVDEDVEIEASLIPVVPESQLRGLVRAFHGAPLAARIRVSGVDEILQTDGEGRFTAELPPGDYVIEIRADGYRQQRRRARVEEGGVTVLNVELRRAR